MTGLTEELQAEFLPYYDSEVACYVELQLFLRFLQSTAPQHLQDDHQIFSFALSCLFSDPPRHNVDFSVLPAPPKKSRNDVLVWFAQFAASTLVTVRKSTPRGAMSRASVNANGEPIAVSVKVQAATGDSSDQRRSSKRAANANDDHHRQQEHPARHARVEDVQRSLKPDSDSATAGAMSPPGGHDNESAGPSTVTLSAHSSVVASRTPLSLDVTGSDTAFCKLNVSVRQAFIRTQGPRYHQPFDVPTLDDDSSISCDTNEFFQCHHHPARHSTDPDHYNGKAFGHYAISYDLNEEGLNSESLLRYIASHALERMHIQYIEELWLPTVCERKVDLESHRTVYWMTAAVAQQLVRWAGCADQLGPFIDRCVKAEELRGARMS